MNWQIYALISAVAAAGTAILIKMGVSGVPANLATAIRTIVVAGFAAAIAVGLGEYRQAFAMPRRAVFLLVLSGLATGVSWFAYIHALKLGPASRVAAIDKLSLPFTVVMAVLLLGEPLTWRVAGGALLITAGALLATS